MATENPAGAAHSITELRNAARTYEALYNGASEAIFMVRVGPDGPLITDCNGRAGELFGYEPQQLVGRSPVEISPQAQPDGTRSIERIQEVVRTAMAGETALFDFTHKHRDGSLFFTEISVSRLDLEDGPRLLVLMRDLTERREAEDKFRSIIQSSPMGIYQYTLEQDGRLVFAGANPAADRIVGVDNTEYIGKTIEEAFPPLAETELPDQYRRVAREGGTWQTEQIVYADDRIAGAFEVYAFQVSPMRMAVFFNEVTERKQAEEERRKLEAQIQHTQKLESLGILAGGIAHDFNNLLMSVLGNADLALNELSPVSPVREYIADIESAAIRAADLCRQMLAYSGKGRFVVEALDLRELVEEMAHILEVSVSKKAVLNLHFADNLPAVRADATQIRQVLMNLITNASEAIGDRSGVISISTGAQDCERSYLSEMYLDDDLPEGLYTYLEVADTGDGMEKEVINRIFDPFYTTKFTGRGLGMAAVLGIVRGHGGAIKIYSEPGKGTTIKVLLPAAYEPAVAADSAASVNKAWTGSGTVLLVDDEETVRAIGGKMLTHLGFEVKTASDGREALRVYRESADEITCILLDLTMPHADGEETFRELRRTDPDVCVVLSSGYNEQDVTQRFAGKGLAGFIQKPYQLETLREVLRRALA